MGSPKPRVLYRERAAAWSVFRNSFCIDLQNIIAYPASALELPLLSGVPTLAGVVRICNCGGLLREHGGFPDFCWRLDVRLF